MVQCEASNLAELARAREKAVLELEELGLHLPQLIGSAGTATTACMTCSDKCTKLFHVQSGSRTADVLIASASKRHGEAAARRVPPQAADRTREAVTAAHVADGVRVCVACAAPRMAEARKAEAEAGETGGRSEGVDEGEIPLRPSRSSSAESNQRACAQAAGAEEAQGYDDSVYGRREPRQRDADSVAAAETLWLTRCSLAVAPRDLRAAFPGVTRCTAVEAGRA